MSQFDFGTIDPATKSGPVLATDLNSWRTAINSGHSGSAKPSYAIAGTQWLDTTSATAPVLKHYDGAQSIEMGTFDYTLNTFVPATGAQVVNNISTLMGITPSGTRRVYVKAHTTEGDGGHGNFRAVTGAAAGTYVHNGATIIVPTGGDGSAAWLRDYEGTIYLTWFDMSSGALAALNAAIAVAAAVTGVGVKQIDLCGLLWELTGPLVWDSGSHVFLVNGGLKAVAGTWTGTDHLVDMRSGTYQCGLSGITLKANHLTGTVHINGARRPFLLNVDGYHFAGIGLLYDSGSIPSFYRVHMHQWLSTDAERTVQANRTAVAARFDHADARVIECTFAWSATPLEIGSNAHHCRFIGNHTYNGSGDTGTVHTNPLNIKVEAGSYSNVITGTYVDNGYIDLYSTDVTITDTVYLYNSATASMTSHVRAYAQVASDTLDELIYESNNHSGSFKVFDLIATGGNSWACNADLETYTDAIDITPNGVNEYRGTISSGYVKRFISSASNSLIQFISNATTGIVDCGASGNDFVVRTAGTVRATFKADGSINLPNIYTTGDVSAANKTVAVADAGTIFNIQNGGTAVAYTLPADAPQGWWIKVQVKGAGVVTLTAATGATLRGVSGGSNTVPQYGVCTVWCGRNSGGTAAEYYLEGVFA